MNRIELFKGIRKILSTDFEDVNKLCSEYFTQLKDNQNQLSLYINFDELEYIAPDVLTYLTSYFIKLRTNSLSFFIKLSINSKYEHDEILDAENLLTKEKINNCFQFLFKIWGIYDIVEPFEYSRYFSPSNPENYLTQKINHGEFQKIFDSFSFVNWNKIITNEIIGLNDSKLNSKIDSIYKDLIEKELQQKYKTKSIKYILLRELIENSIYHSFKTDPNTEVFSSVIVVLDKYIEINVRDFGQGIPNSLRTNPMYSEEENDWDLIKISLSWESSKNILPERYVNLIPRGLSDVNQFVENFDGQIIIRSGKSIFYSKEIRDSQINTISSFEGTQITIRLPIDPETKEIINISEKTTRTKKLPTVKETLNLNFVSNNLYNFNYNNGHNFKINNQVKLIHHLHKKILELLNKYHNKAHLLIYLDFVFFDLNYEETSYDNFKKLLFFLSSSELLEKSDVSIFCIFDSGKSGPIIEINQLINEYRKERNVFSIIPCFFIDSSSNVDLKLLGTTKTEQETIIEYTKYEEHREIDQSLLRNIKIGNIIFYRPPFFQILDELGIAKLNINDLISSPENFNPIQSGFIYITSGGYYQKEFVSFLEILKSSKKSALVGFIANNLIYPNTQFLDAAKEVFTGIENKQIVFLTATVSSQILTESLITKIKNDTDLIIKQKYLPNYYDLDELSNLNKNDLVFLIIDVIATGKLISNIVDKLENLEINLLNIFTLSDIRQSSANEPLNNLFIKEYYIFPKKINSKSDLDLVSVLSNKKFSKNIQKFKFRNLGSETLEIPENMILRVSPYTNEIINNIQNNQHNVLIDDWSVLKRVTKNILDKNEVVNINYIKKNKVFFTYYFESKKIFSSNEGVKFLKRLLSRIKKRERLNEDQDNYSTLLYPRGSGVQSLNFNELYSSDIFNYDTEFHEVFRIKTNEGWKYLSSFELKNNTSKILILDDGSCTGATLMEIIEYVLERNQSVTNIKKITILSVFGRLSDHTDHLFSSLTEIGNIKIEVLFGFKFHVNTFYHHSFSFILEEENLINNNLKFAPQIIKEYGQQRSEEIKIENHEEGNSISNNSPLLKFITLNQINHFDVLHWRSEFGKLVGFKLYKNDFKEFNNILLGYSKFRYSFENDKKPSTNEVLDLLQQIEIILMIVYHEQFLVDVIKKTLPDLNYILKSYLAKVFSGEISPKFKWESHHLVRLFIEIYGIEKLIENITKTTSKLYYYKVFEKVIEDEKCLKVFFFFIHSSLNKGILPHKLVLDFFKFYENLYDNQSIKIQKELNFKIDEFKIFFLNSYYNQAISEFEKSSEYWSSLFRNIKLYKNHRVTIFNKASDVLSIIGQIDAALENKKYHFAKELYYRKNNTLKDFSNILIHLQSLLDPISSTFKFFNESSWSLYFSDNSSISIKKICKNLIDLNLEPEIVGDLHLMFKNFYQLIFETSSDFHKIFNSYDAFDLFVIFKNGLLKSFKQELKILNEDNLTFQTKIHPYLFENFIIPLIIQNIIDHSALDDEKITFLQLKLEQSNNSTILTISNSWNGVPKNGSNKVGLIDLENVLGLYNLKLLIKRINKKGDIFSISIIKEN